MAFQALESGLPVMIMTRIQRKIIKELKAIKSDTIVYKIEDLGYLPDIFYHWLEVDGKDVSENFPKGFSAKDLEALESKGLLEKIDYWKDPNYHDEKTTYKIHFEKL